MARGNRDRVGTPARGVAASTPVVCVFVTIQKPGIVRLVACLAN
ncbi:hypothetical protein I553_5297 [Mycobacterium xenopi 4042]|uniref:Uncharacterized protein n=1 Tax=Mycobacterium xenopi 4042 TaxID=1299334 RepID=X7ZWZ6_MYCXE|nr:hypothetical protein I553_5297 [Mycobacterium xenopi 4042]